MISFYGKASHHFKEINEVDENVGQVHYKKLASPLHLD